MAQFLIRLANVMEFYNGGKRAFKTAETCELMGIGLGRFESDGLRRKGGKEEGKKWGGGKEKKEGEIKKGRKKEENKRGTVLLCRARYGETRNPFT